MHASRGFRQSFLTLISVLSATAVFAQAPATTTEKPAGQFEPRVGQPGKDVVWVPTPQALVDKMLDMAKVTPSDFVMDLGSGDGRTVITAAKRGVKAMGVEYNPDMVEVSKKAAITAGVTDRAQDSFPMAQPLAAARAAVQAPRHGRARRAAAQTSRTPRMRP